MNHPLKRRVAVIAVLSALIPFVIMYFKWHSVNSILQLSRSRFESATDVTVEGKVIYFQRYQPSVKSVNVHINDPKVMREIAEIVYGGISPVGILSATTEDRKYGSANWLSIRARSNSVHLANLFVVTESVVIIDGYDMNHSRKNIYDSILLAITNAPKRVTH